MSTKVRDLSSLPDWPAAMLRRVAAQYCDLGESSFLREVFDGNLPAPFILGGREHWSKVQIDKALAVLSGDAEPDWRVGTIFER